MKSYAHEPQITNIENRTSFTLMMSVLSRSGDVLNQYTYGLIQNLKHLPPEVK